MRIAMFTNNYKTFVGVVPISISKKCINSICNNPIGLFYFRELFTV